MALAGNGEEGVVRGWAWWVSTAACAAVVLGPAAGCGTAGTRPPTAGSTSPPAELKPTRWPAANAGGACHLLNYETVEQTIGVSFEVAAGGQQDATSTCVLQRAGTTVPDLTLAVTPTTIDPTIFRKTVVPKGATALTGLGKAGYQARVPAVTGSGRGPGVEVGWLSGDKRILVLRCTLATDATDQAVTDLTTKLVDLARQLDQPG